VLISPIGAWMIGHLRCSRSVSALADHMAPPAQIDRFTEIIARIVDLKSG
jgi:hypothetical protein